MADWLAGNENVTPNSQNCGNNYMQYAPSYVH